MCMACEMGFWDMIDALPPEARERFLREQEAAARFACDAPAPEPGADAAPTTQATASEPKS
jgi:hypothetical protein